MPRYKVPLYRKDDPANPPEPRFIIVRADTAELARTKADKRHPKWIAGHSKFYGEVPERDKSMDWWLVLFVLFSAFSIVMVIIDPAPEDADEVDCTLRGCQ